MNENIKMLEVAIDGNNKKNNDVDKEINRIQKATRRRTQKDRKNQDLLLKLSMLNNSKSDLKIKIDVVKQIISHIEEVKDEVKLKTKELEKKFNNNPKENPFDITEYVEKQKEENEIDLGMSLQIAEENKITFNRTPVNTLNEDMENLKKGCFTNGYFSLGDGKEIDTNGFFKDSDELAKFIDKI